MIIQTIDVIDNFSIGNTHKNLKYPKNVILPIIHKYFGTESFGL